MGLLQSLGLAGASKALRRLLHRPSRSSPAHPAPLTSSPEPKDAPANPSTTSSERGTVLSPQADPNLIQSSSNKSSQHQDEKDSAMLKPTNAQIVKLSGTAAAPSEKLHRRDAADSSNKENQRPQVEVVADDLAGINIGATVPVSSPEHTVTKSYDSDDPLVQAEKELHQRFTEEALDMARLALRTNETPVGCVLVHRNTVVAKGMNATNVTRNGTRHAEFMALTALLSYPPEHGPRTTRLLNAASKNEPTTTSDNGSVTSVESDKSGGNDDGSKGHLYPYGQKFHPDAKVDQSILQECDLYVTVEPCVMCASLLRQFGIRKVYFGAVNDKFGGTGGVFSIHANADPNAVATRPRSISRAPPSLTGAAGTLGESFPVGGGDGGNVERGYEIEGGWGRDEAVGLLRRFYVQENGRAPVPRKKEGRAARLAAMMDKDGPDAVCAALLYEDGMMAMDQGQAAPASDDASAAVDRGDSRSFDTDKITGNATIGDDNAESDKENAPLST
ncbi:cytidine and deoxycytidylate deaminase zinc-binding region domain-containing protein [Sarocladium implicatum]|nr:cytidine and deoxycytidylate deaminase zinc-binding region domain-containing protein [Sarocladium implicatum]